MYRLVLPCIAIVLIVILIYAIYRFTLPSEGFLTSVPPQTYIIPQLQGASARYVRIRPSNTHGDGYLTISQIQVLDINGTNIALNKKVTATSTGGSPIDQKYGKEVKSGAAYILVQGTSADVSCIVDGILYPRSGLTNIFETGTKNTSADTEYVEIDLESSSIVNKIIYTGRLYPQNTTINTIDGTIDTIDQVSRLTNMRIQLFNVDRVMTYSTTFSDDPITNISTITINAPLATAGFGSSALQTIMIPNLASYAAVVKPFLKYRDIDMINPNIDLIKQANTMNNTTEAEYGFDVSGGLFSTLVSESPINFYNEIYLSSGCTPTSTNTMCKANDNCSNVLISGCGMVRPPNISRLDPWRPTYAKGTGTSLQALNENLSIQIFGSVSEAAKKEMSDSIEYCKSIFLGNPALIENYIAVKYVPGRTQFQSFIRNPGSLKYCMPDLFQVFSNGEFVTKKSTKNQAWNTANCTTEITPQLLSLIPEPSRKFIIQWIQGRCVRYISYENTIFLEAIDALVDKFKNRNYDYLLRSYINSQIEAIVPAGITQAGGRLLPIQAGITSAGGRFLPNNYQNPTDIENSKKSILPEVATAIVVTPPLNILSTSLLDSIAQQFYEMLGGQMTMTYIYDVFTLGSTMLDVRFDLNVHTDGTTSYLPIQALKDQYKAFLASGAKTRTQDMVDQAKIDYQNTLQNLELDHINNSPEPFQGAIVRLFYIKTPATGAITITGMIFDSNAVTSFVPQLNGGISTSIGPQSGNVNYVTKIKYTLNKPQETLDCSNPDTLSRIMDDYVSMVEDNPKILKEATPSVDPSQGTLNINKIIGAVQISPTQCAVQWLETVYDPVTNLPVSSGSNNILSNQCGFNSVERNALFSYYIDKAEWYSPNLIFDLSGFKLYPTNTIPACTFDIETYKTRTGNRFTSATNSPSDIQKIQDDFINNTFINTNILGYTSGSTGLQTTQTTSITGGEICPQTIPKYGFNPIEYLAANSLPAGTDAISHYKTIGLAAGLPVKRPTTIVPFTSMGSSGSSIPTPIVYTKPLPSQYTLDSGKGVCPVTYCDDLDVLYSLVDQYNSNPALAGTILRVNRAFTAGPNQCDIDVDINYDSMIPNIIGQSIVDPNTGIASTNYPMIKKGTVTYTTENKKTVEGSKPMTLAGVQSVTLALYIALDTSACSYIVSDASGANSGFSIQPNTPYLYKPLNYAAKLLEKGSSIGSTIGKIQSDITSTSGSVKDILTKYRANTYTAIGSINTLSSCGGKSCSDQSIKNQIINYYNEEMGPSDSIVQILNTGSPEGSSCDVTFTNRSNQTVGMNFGFNSACRIISRKSINPRPTYTNVENLDAPLSTANVSGFTDYSSSELPFTNPNLSSTPMVKPLTQSAEFLTQRGFGLDRVRNSTDSLTTMQFTKPLEQIPPTSVPQEISPSYKFIRLSSTKTRDPSSFSVGIGKISFFHEGKRLDLQGLAKVTNPMGTWEGSLEDVTGNGMRSGWTDAHKKPLVFSFKDSILVDAYSITTATGSPGSDPVAWKLEGSVNGTFWTVLNIQTRFPTPVDRFKEIQPIAFSV